MRGFIENYIESSRKQFEYNKTLGDKTFEQLPDDALFMMPSSESNSIAIIVNHLHGNMMSRWTDFLDTDGEKPWRKRDEEFEDVLKTREALLDRWNEGWRCLFAAIEKIDHTNFETQVYIRNMGHSVVEAINRQLCHYAYHVGQIVYLGRLFQNEKWKSLSIPKGTSEQYNEEKFSQNKSRRHFTDEFLK